MINETTMVAGWPDAIALWLFALRAAGMSKNSLRLRRYQLTRLGHDLEPTGPWSATGLQLVTWLGSQDWGPTNNTLASFRAGVRSFYGWAAEVGYVERDPSRALPRVRPAKGRPHPTPEDAYRQALANAPSDRERLMLRLAAELGMRRGEVAVAHAHDLLQLPTGWWLAVHGKGGKARTLPVSPGLASAIRREAIAHGNGYLWPGQIDGHLSAGYVGKIVARLLPGVWAMHSLRHRFGSAVRAVGGDLLDAQLLLGHEHLSTTQIYVLAPDEGLREVVEAVGRL